MLRALVLTALAAVVSVGTAAAQAEQPRIEAYADDLVWSCPPANPSCTRDHWSIEHNELQDDTRVTYAAIGARFTTERRFAEAVNVVWQWPEGKTLLRQANDSGVLIISIDYDRQTSFATYSPQRELIAINRRYVAAPTWMLAGVLAHELTHASDHALGIHEQPNAGDCIARESAAFEAQRRYLVWLTRSLQPEGLPTLPRLMANLSTEHSVLARNLYEMGLTDTLPALVQDTYEGTC